MLCQNCGKEIIFWSTGREGPGGRCPQFNYPMQRLRLDPRGRQKAYCPSTRKWVKGVLLSESAATLCEAEGVDVVKVLVPHDSVCSGRRPHAKVRPHHGNPTGEPGASEYYPPKRLMLPMKGFRA